MRFVLVRTHEGADDHYLVSTMDHSIADAQAGMMMNDELFRYLANPEEMEALPPVQIGLPPSLEEGLPNNRRAAAPTSPRFASQKRKCRTPSALAAPSHATSAPMSVRRSALRSGRIARRCTAPSVPRSSPRRARSSAWMR